MKKTIILFLLIVNLSHIFSAGSVYDRIFDLQELQRDIYRPELSLQTYNTLSNNMLLSEEYLDSITFPIMESQWMNLYLINPDLFFSYNTKVAHSYNDGNMWQGRGFNGKVTTGLYLDSRYFSMTLLPEFWFAENRDFPIIETEYSNGFGDYWQPFDNLQRYGDESYSQMNLGETDIRFKLPDYFTIGISNQHISLGPGVYNNIVLGEQGVSFPHIDFGTYQPFPIFGLVFYEFRTIYGVLEESEFFNDDDSDNYGWYSGLSVGITPAISPNFRLGINHYYTKPLDSFDSMDLLRHIPGVDTYNSPTDLKDTIASVTMEYYSTAAKLNIYGEIARNDQLSSVISLWTEPEHAIAYTLGMSKELIELQNNNSFFLSFEHTGLQQQRTLEHRFAGPYYRHWVGYKQGYSNSGQLLGSTIGPGSNSQSFKITYVYKKGSADFIIQRIAHDKDYYYKLVNNYSEIYGESFTRADAVIKPYVELIFGLKANYKIGDITLLSEFNVDYHNNYLNVRTDDFFNFYYSLGVNYSF